MSKRTIVEWSPHDASLFAVGADNLRLFEATTASPSLSGYADTTLDPATAAAATTQRKRTFRVVRIHAKVSQLKCLQWYPFDSKPLLIATGTGSGKVLLCDFDDPRARVMREFVPKYSRPCHAVAWNPSVSNQLAAGFEKVRSDFCTLVWDLNTSNAGSSATGAAATAASAGAMTSTSSCSSGNMDGLVDQDGTLERPMSSRKGSSNGGASASVGVAAGSAGFATVDSKPVHELANSEATMALSWVPLQPTCLATGTGFKWLRVYDLRTKGSSPMSVVAHNKAVLGVVFDQHRPHMLATYSDAPQEPVKVWDIRQLESSSGPLLSLYQTSKNLAQVSWCPSEPGVLVTASTEEKWVSLWDVTKQESRPSMLKKPFRRRYTSEPLASFSWQHIDSSPQMQCVADVGRTSIATRDQLTAAAFPNRLLTASITGELGDISVHDAMPLSLSSHGAVTFGCGRLLFGGSVSGPGLGTSAVARLTLEEEISSGPCVEEDISNEMYKLAKQGYSVGLSKNLKLFNKTSPRGRQLHHLWSWVDQVEALRRFQASRVEQSRSANNGLGNNAANTAVAGPLRGWPVDSNALVIAGVKNLLTAYGEASAIAKSAPAGHTATVQEDSREEELTVAVASVTKVDQVLGCQYFEGPGRRLSMLACNWDPENGQGGSRVSAGVGGPEPDSATGRNIHRSSSNIWYSQKQQYDETANSSNRSWNENGRYELQNILNRCELEGNYAQAAALAVFHGDLNAAVALLQRGATWMTQMQHLNVGVSSPYTPDLLQLIAMSVAGYSSSVTNSGGLSLWLSMTQQLLKRSEIMSQANPRYFHAMLSFLCVTSSSCSSSTMNSNAMRANQQPSRRPLTRRQWGSVDGLAAFVARPASAGAYSTILHDVTLPLSDRLAFACRYLQADDLLAFVNQHEKESEQYGRLEGLLVTGINGNGIRLLQTYLDMTGDIQTLALLAARVPSSYKAESSPMEKWIQIYKDLLNQWQLFHERARFDVGRSQLEDLLNGFASVSRECDADDRHTEGVQEPSTLSVPPQLFVRCNFCNASLSLACLLRLGGSHSSWLNRAKPKLTCCPTCRKPLPQCALCLLPFGSLNPYFEMAHRRSRQTSDAVNTLVTSVAADYGGVLKEPKTSKNEYENLGQLSSIPFVEWFTWCQSCKHGGHAHHLADWFRTHTVCPVTDCNCQCQHLDLPIVGDDNQTTIIEHQRSSIAALAAQRAAAKEKKAQQQQQYHQQNLQDMKAPLRAGKKLFLDKQQQQVPPEFQSSQHNFSMSATIGTGSTYRSFSSAQLRPSGSSSGYPPPFSLSGSNSGANLLGGANAVGAGSNVGSGSVSDGIFLGNKLDQLEKDKSSYQYM
uniref:WD repeat protein mio zinc-ribbon like domain-containing protein n=1 Tax=Peronospora matthiolae TaxID=2874970 RepID=A0AAV1U7S2_9STRA